MLVWVKQKSGKFNLSHCFLCIFVFVVDGLVACLDLPGFAGQEEAQEDSLLQHFWVDRGPERVGD